MNEKTVYEHLGYPIDKSRIGIHHSERRYLLNDNKLDNNLGLWGSRYTNLPKESFTWREWVEQEDFRTDLYLDKNNTHLFELTDDAKILTINGNISHNKLEKHGVSSSVIFGLEHIPESIIDEIFSDKQVLIKYNDSRIYDESFDQSYGSHHYDELDLNWEYVVNNYDGVELLNGICYNMFRYRGFYTWDCDSIVVWNADKIIIL